MPSANPNTKSLTVNLRVKPEIRALIDRAAKAQGKSRTAFILDSARAAAEETLLDQWLPVASRQAYAELLARLDHAPAPSPGLLKVMRTPGPWDEV
ncbi:MAG TPA: DUF1778 domain-containing protein [Rhodocyclaceae bacterium]|nr:DUF1778 domain-containing protein [Rhodocyclaceae bacterium]